MSLKRMTDEEADKAAADYYYLCTGNSWHEYLAAHPFAERVRLDTREFVRAQAALRAVAEIHNTQKAPHDIH